MTRGQLIALPALAKRWGWSVSKLHRLVATKQIPHLRVGERRDVFFEEEAIERWLDARRVAEAGARSESAAPRPRARSVEEECQALGIQPDPAFL